MQYDVYSHVMGAFSRFAREASLQFSFPQLEVCVFFIVDFLFIVSATINLAWE